MERGQDKRLTNRKRIEPRKYAQIKEQEKKNARKKESKNPQNKSIKKEMIGVLKGESHFKASKNAQNQFNHIKIYLKPLKSILAFLFPFKTPYLKNHLPLKEDPTKQNTYLKNKKTQRLERL